MTIVGNDMSSIYRDMCKELRRYGLKVKVRGLYTVELIDTHIQLYDPKLRYVNFHARDMNMRYFIGELCHYLDARTDLASIAHYSQFWEKVSDDGKTINSAYGYRLFGLIPQVSSQIQFKYAIRCLEADASSRKAVMTIYHPSDARESKDNPCTLNLQFLIRAEQLILITNMRSQDVWRGVPYDFAFFTLVQEIAWVILRRKYPELRLGPYYHNVASLHVYKEHYKGVDEVSEERDHNQIRSPEISDTDVDNWFDDLLTYEKSKRGTVLYKQESRRTLFQDWCKALL